METLETLREKDRTKHNKNINYRLLIISTQCFHVTYIASLFYTFHQGIHSVQPCKKKPIHDQLRWHTDKMRVHNYIGKVTFVSI